MDLAKLINDEKLAELFNQAVIERVKLGMGEKKLSIYILSRRLLQYKDVERLKKELEKQFPPSECQLEIKVRFALSEQYNLANILTSYWQSILAEAKEKLGMMLYSILKEAKWQAEDDRLTLQVPLSPFVSKSEKILAKYLKDILQERFDKSVEVSFNYLKPKIRKITPVYQQKPKGEIPAPVKEEPPKKEDKPIEPVSAKKKKANDDPNLVYGRTFEGNSIPISEINDAIGEVIISGQIFQIESRELRNEKTLVIFSLTDFTDSINCKVFLEKEQKDEFLEKIKEKVFVKVKGMALADKFDRDISISSIRGIRLIEDFTLKRMDNAVEKRVELHLHTLMSDMDGLVDPKALIARAKAWGHDAVAITDHGVVQGFTEAYHELAKDDPLKLIYGCEIYLVDDLKQAVQNAQGQALMSEAVVFDLETTGFNPRQEQIIEIGAVKLKNGEIVERFSTFVNPQKPISYEIEKLTGINDQMVLDAPKIEEVLPQFVQFCAGAAVVAHNADFDNSFIAYQAEKNNLTWDKTVIDTVSLGRILLPELSNYKLDTIAKALDISLENHHRAVDDAQATAEIYQKFLQRLAEKGVETLAEINEQGRLSAEVIKKMPTYHAVLLAQNDVGRVNLYKLISWSHLDYYARRPRIPRSVLEENREVLGMTAEINV